MFATRARRLVSWRRRQARKSSGSRSSWSARNNGHKMSDSPRWNRILLKLSGEAFAGGRDFGFEAATVKSIAREVASVHNAGVEVAIVVGGGNIMRGAIAAESGMERVAADSIGMLATVQNALALQD